MHEPQRVIDSPSSKTKKQYDSFELSPELLEQAKKVTLSDLFDCPATQCWALSMLGNAVAFSAYFSETMLDNDGALIYKLQVLFNGFPPATRSKLLSQTGELIRMRRDRRTHHDSET